MATIKKTDTVIILAGKDKGKKGKVLRVMPADSQMIVEGVNEQKRHQKARRTGEKGQLVTKNAPISMSNALYFCNKCAKGVRLGSKMVGDKKVRVCKTCGMELA